MFIDQRLGIVVKMSVLSKLIYGIKVLAGFFKKKCWHAVSKFIWKYNNICMEMQNLYGIAFEILKKENEIKESADI